jgi:UDP-glucose 4-epimerase
MANVNDIYKNPLETAIVNFQGVVNVLEAMRRYGGRLILASTVWVYMLSHQKKVHEDTPLLVQNVSHTYTASKVAAELYVQSYSRLYDTEFTILRYGIPYGPRGRQGTVVANFIQRAVNGQTLSIDGDGSQYRNFVYVEDLAEGNVAALSPMAKNKVYNLEGMRPITIREVAETTQKLIDGVAIEYREARPGDFRGTIASNEKALAELGWAPKVDLEEGMRKYLDWYLQHVKPESELRVSRIHRAIAEELRPSA